MLVKVSKMHCMMLLKFKVQNHLHSDQNDFMSYIRDHYNHIQKWSVIQGLHRDHETFLNFNCSFIGRNGQHLLLQLLFTLKITFLAYLPLLVKNSIDHDYYLASRCDVNYGFPLITIIRWSRLLDTLEYINNWNANIGCNQNSNFS